MRKLVLFVFALIAIMSLVAFYISKKDHEKRHYTQALQPQVGDQDDGLSKSIARGEELYSDFCMQCHLVNGEGVPNTYPPLAKSDWLIEKRTESIHAVKYGQKGLITVNDKPYNSVMTPMGLNNQEVTDLMNFIMNSWGNKQEQMVTVDEVTKVEK